MYKMRDQRELACPELFTRCYPLSRVRSSDSRLNTVNCMVEISLSTDPVDAELYPASFSASVEVVAARKDGVRLLVVRIGLVAVPTRQPHGE